GERQLIALARAVVRDPKILILDEATANIDPVTEAYIQDAMEKVTQGRTVLIIAHRLSTIRNADRILVFHKGRIVESGTHNELFAKNGLYTQLYRLQYELNG
ncbi:MAG TPA: ATP-binding cassette domain-containing protein, partial [Thermotogota bacterium]|nr:ATP-binding cassette domain-containing protein [Thermotogota bacterium]